MLKYKVRFKQRTSYHSSLFFFWSFKVLIVLFGLSIYSNFLNYLKMCIANNVACVNGKIAFCDIKKTCHNKPSGGS